MKQSFVYVILVALLVIGSTRTFGQTDVDITNRTVDEEESASHIWFLASDELKGRDTGSPELEIAASYIASRLRSYGVKPFGDDSTYFQKVPLESVKPPEAASLKYQTNSFLALSALLFIAHPQPALYR